MSDFILCSNCFQDQGLKIDAEVIGQNDESACLNCNESTGQKLDKGNLLTLSQRFFVWGSLQRFDYGAAPLVQFNYQQTTSIKTSPWLEPDLRILEKAIGIGFFHYGPRFWMFGDIEPLKELQEIDTRASIINRVIDEYPTITFTPENTFYRVRMAPLNPREFQEYDSPPKHISGSGRFDSKELSVMYGSQDLQVCIHECRVSAADDLFVATLAPCYDLKLLDLTELIYEDVSEFESLDMSIHMLFLAGEHSYKISQDIALAAKASGYDGIIYPSYFSLLRTGAMPFETVYGISPRQIPQLADREKSKIIPNLALFGRPIEQEQIEVKCINRVILNRVEYGIHFGPVEF